MIVPDVLPAAFEDAALARFVEQFEGIEAYRKFCLAVERTPGNVTDWREIPLIPVTAFKTAVLCTEAAHGDPVRTFHTSGTSDGRPGVVQLGDDTAYIASLHASFEHFVVPDAPGRMRCISLVPGPNVRPHSSLGFMVDELIGRHGDGKGSNHIGASHIGASHIGASSDLHGVVDSVGLRMAFDDAIHDGAPVLLFATTIALHMAMQSWPEGLLLVLPQGSRVMDTGGSKGRKQSIDRLELIELLSQRLGIGPSFVVGELGMTELCSQRYETVLRARLVGDVAPARAFAGPPWLMSVVLDPMTMRQTGGGEIGMIGHLDLANVSTCAFVLTADMGRLVRIGGQGSCLELHGRAPGSVLRGCGLDVEML